MITIYGRNPVLEALLDPSLSFFRLHLAESNKPADIIQQITRLAKERQVDIARHSKQALSRISKNGRQDQGVALDIVTPAHASLESPGTKSGQYIKRSMAACRRHYQPAKPGHDD